jgi:alpha-galactosidase/6-phospho-beta-glucosidase family protein
MGCGSPAKQTKNPGFTDKLYEKAEVIKDKMKNLEKDAFIRSNYSSEGYEESRGEKKAQRKLKRLGKKLTRVEKREKKKRAKYNY